MLGTVVGGSSAAFLAPYLSQSILLTQISLGVASSRGLRAEPKGPILMKKAMLVGLLASLVAALVTGPARAAEEARSKAYIVLVGISNYADKQIKPRTHAEADAKALYDLFTNKDYLGVDAEARQAAAGHQGRRAATASRPPTRTSSRRCDWAVKQGRQGRPGRSSPSSARAARSATGDRATSPPTPPSRTATRTPSPPPTSSEELENLKSQRFVAFLDVNFKGFDAGKETVAEPNPHDLYKEFLGDDEQGRPQPPPGRVVFLATNGLTPRSTWRSTACSPRPCSTASRARPTRKATSRTASSPSMN